LHLAFREIAKLSDLIKVYVPYTKRNTAQHYLLVPYPQIPYRPTLALETSSSFIMKEVGGYLGGIGRVGIESTSGKYMSALINIESKRLSS
jgi:hypothetical protein